MIIENLHLSINETEALFTALQEYKTSCHCVMNRSRADLIQDIIDKFKNSSRVDLIQDIIDNFNKF